MSTDDTTIETPHASRPQAKAMAMKAAPKKVAAKKPTAKKGAPAKVAAKAASKKPAAMMSNSQLEAIRLQSQMVAPRKVGTSGPSMPGLRQVVACSSTQAMGFARARHMPCVGQGARADRRASTAMAV